MKVLTWLWQQHPPRHNFNAEKVNKWAVQMRKYLTIPHKLACVTDIPEGLDPDIEVIPLPKEFRSVRVEKWTEASGAPQCYVRLNLWHPNARKMFGADWIVSMDCDVIAIRSLDDLFTDRSADVRIFNGTGKNRPYNGGLVMLKAGSRPQVYEEFAKNPAGVASQAREISVGSDQSVISLILGRGEKTYGEEDGVYYYSPRVMRLHGGFRNPPENLRLLFFPGAIKPWDDVGYQWMRDAWDGLDVCTNNRPIYVYDDPEGFGAALEEAAQRKSVRFHLFRQVYPDRSKRGALLRGLKAMPHDRNIKRRLAEMDNPPIFQGVAFVRLVGDGPGVARTLKNRGVPVLTLGADESRSPESLVDELLKMAEIREEAA